MIRTLVCSAVFAAVLGSQIGVCGDAVPAAAPPFATANDERLIGAWEDGEPKVAVFRGIPFAAPPVGDMRWRAPAKHRPRTGPQPAMEFAPACMQGNGILEWYVEVAEAFGAKASAVNRPAGVSENCLYLNIWTPSPADFSTMLPVLVFVHGGSNAGGWSYEPNYRGAELARAGAVVVTIAYRLGPFGFFAHEALGDGATEPVANFALLDIRAAFEWVREHIAAFGGDPGAITAFGESAGAFNLLDLLLEDMARGTVRDSPFRRVILQSTGGPMFERRTLAEEQAVGRKLAGMLDLGEAVTAGQLRSVPAPDLLSAAARLPDEYSKYYPAGITDGRVLTANPRQVAQNAPADGVRMIVGTNADEWLMYLDESTGRDDLFDWVRKHGPQRAEALLAAVADEDDPRKALDRLITAREMLCPSLALADAVNENGGRAWAYFFSRQRPGRGGKLLGAYHGAELPYVFGTHDDWLPTNFADRDLTQEVMDRWLSMARTGSPDVAGRLAWPAYGRARPEVLTLDEPVRITKATDRELCDLLGALPAPRATGG